MANPTLPRYPLSPSDVKVCSPEGVFSLRDWQGTIIQRVPPAQPKKLVLRSAHVIPVATSAYHLGIQIRIKEIEEGVLRLLLEPAQGQADSSTAVAAVPPHVAAEEARLWAKVPPEYRVHAEEFAGGQDGTHEFDVADVLDDEDLYAD